MQQLEWGISTWIWTSPFTSKTVELFPLIKSMGYSVVEIPVEDPDLIDGPEVMKALRDNGLRAVVCGAFGPDRDFTHTDSLVHQNCMDYVKRCFDLCGEWESNVLIGPMYSAVGKVRMLSAEDRIKDWNLAIFNLQKVCEMAGKRGLSIGIEPLNRFESDMVNTAADALRMVEDIDHPSAQIMLDTFHMNIEETDMIAAILLVKDYLLHFQVSDSHRGVPGTGLAPWSSIKEGLELAQYKGVVSIESFTPEVVELAGAVCIWRKFIDNQDDFAKDGIAFLKKLLQS